MDASTYYVTTLTAAAKNLFPIIASIGVGYFCFIKLPFLFFAKVVRENHQTQNEDQFKLSPDMPLEKPRGPSATMTKNREADEKMQKEMKEKILRMERERRSEEARRRKHTESEKNESKKEAKPEVKDDLSAESVFHFKKGEVFTKKELKHRYHRLIKLNHPDKATHMGQEFMDQAEKKSKAINMAYEKLKNKAG